MNTIRNVLGISFGLALVAACSSSNSPTGTSTSSNQPAGGGSGGGSGSGSGGSGSGSGGGPTIVGGGQQCGPLFGSICSSGLHCCDKLSDNSTMCASTCPPGTIITDCTSPNDCKGDPTKPICCGIDLLGATPEGGAPNGGGVQCAATCPTDTSITFCATNADCTGGQTCAAGPATRGITMCGAARDGG